MNKQENLIKDKHKILIKKHLFKYNSYKIALYLNIEMMTIGFILSKECFNKVKYLSKRNIIKLYNNIMPILKNMNNVTCSINNNFPNYYIEEADFNIVENIILEYWSNKSKYKFTKINSI